MKQIPLNTRSGVPLVALADDEDYALVSPYSWHPLHAEVTYYAKAHIKDSAGVWRTVLMHRLILGLAPGERGPDHRNRHGWDNRRANLDMVRNTERDQKLNRRVWGGSQYRGVSFYPARPNTGRKTDKWRAYVYDQSTSPARQRVVGYFDTEQAAAIAVDEARDRLGMGGWRNFPLD